jgi:hypothetical protein
MPPLGCGGPPDASPPPRRTASAIQMVLDRVTQASLQQQAHRVLQQAHRV